MKPLAVLLGLLFTTPQTTPEYTIDAIRFGTLPQFRVSGLVYGAPADEVADIAMVVWLIRGNGRNILFDSGYHRQTPGFDRFKTTDYIRPDEAVKLAGAKDRVIPGHDPRQFGMFPTRGRIAKIR